MENIGIVSVHLEYFMAFRYTLWSLVEYFFLFWYLVPSIIWEPWNQYEYISLVLMHIQRNAIYHSRMYVCKKV
jgi:hypothetical protein